MFSVFRIFLLRCASGAVCEAHRLVRWSVGCYFHSHAFLMILLLCYLLIDGYSLFSLILASLFVNCQLMVEFLLFRCSCQSATSFFISSMVEICLFKHCLFKTCNSISAILSQLPCFGVNTKSNLSHILLASSGSNASYSAPGVCVLKLSITNVILSACGNISSDIFLIK